MGVSMILLGLKESSGYPLSDIPFLSEPPSWTDKEFIFATVFFKEAMTPRSVVSILDYKLSFSVQSNDGDFS